ncbi:MAG TPA: DNA polymerase III subunit gamma/tau [Ktedonobacteraceae bacterium]|nr:DNA polymerase III subunit gamma/tau [Ktedonobacteraceae bacterium]
MPTMASQSLYRKWRSQTFHDLVGQEAVVRTLKNALSSGKLAHAYLFTGPRGTGKTSIARLLAKTVNCEHPVDGEPCNQCQQCREITAGNSFNVIEIDAASNRGIDSIRDLREKVMMPPSTGKYKVYILDEAHMLTTEAFNALLKTLEEPPPYVIFVLATTDVHKMLPTVISRCQPFDFKRFSTRQIVDHLNFVAGEEHIKLERSAAELIARAAAGGMRDALSLLDQAMAYAGTEIAVTQVQAMLGVADARAVQKFIAHVAQLDSPAGLHLIHELSQAGADLRQVNIQIGEFWRWLMLAKAGADINVILDLTEDETKEIKALTPLFTLEELTELARVFAQNDMAQKSQGTPQLGLELALLQAIDLHQRAQSGQPLIAAAPPVAAIGQASPPGPSAPPRSALPSQVTPRSAPARNQPESAVDEPWPGDDDVPLAVQSERAPTSRAPAARPAPLPVSEQPAERSVPDGGQSQPTLTLAQVEDRWEKVKKRVRVKNHAGLKTAAYLNDYAVVSVEPGDGASVVTIQAAHMVHYKYLHESEYCADVEDALSLEFRQPCQLRLLPPGQPLPPPAPRSAEYQTLAPPASPPGGASPVHRQRSNTAPTAPEQQGNGPEASKPPRSQQAPAPVAELPAADSPAPVVKKGVVRENMNGTSAYHSPEEITQKASHDPVVREVIHTFSAKIINVEAKRGA